VTDWARPSHQRRQASGKSPVEMPPNQSTGSSESGLLVRRGHDAGRGPAENKACAARDLLGRIEVIEVSGQRAPLITSSPKIRQSSHVVGHRRSLESCRRNSTLSGEPSMIDPKPLARYGAISAQLPILAVETGEARAPDRRCLVS
jgi:hypothetical protein